MPDALLATPAVSATPHLPALAEILPMNDLLLAQAASGSLFADPKTLVLGVLTGLVFGFLLQKGGVTRYGVIVGQFLLRDFTVLKVMLTAVVVGAVGVYGMRAVGMDVPLHVKGTAVAMNLIGGVLFGAGMAVAGYCPGTGMAALGDGSRHAAFAVLGMLAGAGVYAELDAPVKGAVGSVGDLGKVTFADVTGLSIWWFVLAVVVLAACVFAALESFGPKRGGGSGGTTATDPAAPAPKAAAPSTT